MIAAVTSFQPEGSKTQKQEGPTSNDLLQDALTTPNFKRIEHLLAQLGNLPEKSKDERGEFVYKVVVARRDLNNVAIDGLHQLRRLSPGLCGRLACSILSESPSEDREIVQGCAVSHLANLPEMTKEHATMLAASLLNPRAHVRHMSQRSLRGLPKNKREQLLGLLEGSSDAGLVDLRMVLTSEPSVPSYAESSAEEDSSWEDTAVTPVQRKSPARPRAVVHKATPADRRRALNKVVLPPESTPSGAPAKPATAPPVEKLHESEAPILPSPLEPFRRAELLSSSLSELRAITDSTKDPHTLIGALAELAVRVGPAEAIDKASRIVWFLSDPKYKSDQELQLFCSVLYHSRLR